MATLSTLPTYAPPSREVQVRFALTESGSNYVRVWVTAAPVGSALRTKLDESTQHRVEVYKGAGGEAASWRQTFEVGGRYTLVAQEYTRGASGYGGGYPGSPDAAPSETKVGSETTLSLYIGQRLTSELGFGGDTATLVLWVWDETIRETTKVTHGEDSPALQSEAPTTKVQAALESTAVTNALLALRNITAATAAGTAGAVFADLVLRWNAHLTQSSVHQANDSDNNLALGLGSVGNSDNLPAALTEALPRIRNHYTNDASFGAVTFGRDSGNYHDVSGLKNDNVNMPLVTGVGSPAEAYWALADLWRSYEAHRVSTSVHDSADTTNAATTLPLLLQVALQFFTVIAATNPTVPQTQSTGAIALISGAAFEETPL